MNTAAELTTSNLVSVTLETDMSTFLQAERWLLTNAGAEGEGWSRGRTTYYHDVSEAPTRCTLHVEVFLRDPRVAHALVYRFDTNKTQGYNSYSRY
ncbi:MAG: hypothetical protein EOP83_14695 [Verrucomicrobiaceae bacterium]|nr:MAG: hypothetical protein EOP83_14695 [Verrucomicrobiaceae bacterium]